MLVSYISIVSETCRDGVSCYGDGSGGFELNSHVITVACLSVSIGGSVLNENSDNVEGKGLFCCYFILLAFCIQGPTDSLVCGVAWLVQLCVLN